jgi:TPR repeat protein
MYAVGKGVVQDYAEAFKWFSMSSEPGHAVAQHWLGTLYMNGLGVPKNDAEAVKWFLEAAEQGFVQSQHNLGYMYANGLSVPQDSVKAYMWALILKRNPGFDDPANALAASLDALDDQMTSTQITEARALADEWSEKHN